MTCSLSSDPQACLARRRDSMQLQPGDPRNWQRNECANCKTGRENAVLAHTPEVESIPFKPHHRIAQKCVSCGEPLTRHNKSGYCLSCKSAAFGQGREHKRCSQCGKELSLTVQYQTQSTGLCRDCYRAARKQPKQCKQPGCDNKARRNGMCGKHATQAYREMAHRIAQKRMAAPKGRIVPCTASNAGNK